MERIRMPVAAANHDRAPRGTAAYFLARLERERPDLAARVRTGELTAYGAAIEAGFRKSMIMVPEDPEGAADAILRRWGANRARRVGLLLLQKAVGQHSLDDHAVS
jgi:hypothetical protein